MADNIAAQGVPKRVHFDQTPHNSTLIQHRHCWKVDDSGTLDPAWPREPDVTVARALAVAHLPHEYADAAIAPFAQGAFHCLYTITAASAASPQPQYLMRVALPADPFFKIESEVATMEYVREHSSLPIPRVIAFCSDASNPLGFEWILMEKIVDGVPLDDVWDDMTFEAKTKLTLDFAHRIKPLMDLRFSLLGNIYFSDVWNEFIIVNNNNTDVDIGVGSKYAIGRMVHPRFFAGKRLFLPADRGPFRSSRDLVMAEMSMVRQTISHLAPLPGMDYYSAVDEFLARDHPQVLDTFDRLYQAATKTTHFFPADPEEKDNSPNILWHDDLSGKNVLVNPGTHELVGVIDWESTCVVPTWDREVAQGGVPYFLRGIEASEPEPMPVGTAPEDAWRWTEIQKDWDLVMLRKRYHEIVGPVFEVDEVLNKYGAVRPGPLGMKRTLSDALGDFEEHWMGTRYMLSQLDDDDDDDDDDGENSDGSEDEDEDDSDADDDDDDDDYDDGEDSDGSEDEDEDDSDADDGDDDDDDDDDDDGEDSDGSEDEDEDDSDADVEMEDKSASEDDATAASPVTDGEALEEEQLHSWWGVGACALLMVGLHFIGKSIHTCSR
ncbi:hypothetical protein B0H66DRAFT_478142 [Apodospora peruviana]|uniref:Aminoglycoside phosphotransferase domain-containing protein n=1 Tax=Apodospora peruviana TaxID=516989 RepID=A0AAE0M2L3_9PEZI|nr:hypothetical protein B0H66DRAFT_478142 [Apodospora peruviana]